MVKGKLVSLELNWVLLNVSVNYLLNSPNLLTWKPVHLVGDLG